MGKTKINDIEKLLEMRADKQSLREIGKYFDVSPEAVRLALKNAKDKKRQMNKAARLLFPSIIDQGKKDLDHSAKNSTQVLDDWIIILQAAKKAALLEEEVVNLSERLTKIENRVNQLTDKVYEGQDNPSRANDLM